VFPPQVDAIWEILPKYPNHFIIATIDGVKALLKGLVCLQEALSEVLGDLLTHYVEVAE
jgi:hypothetical protein